MSRKYQSVIVLKAQGSDEGIDETVSNIGQEIEEAGAKLEQIDQLGRREFVYNARHVSHGFYVNYQFEADPEFINKLRDKLALNKSVHLQNYDRLPG
jgi:small subunit ribosomal protein S6